MKNKILDDEIDLLGIILTLLNNKLKVTLFSAIALVMVIIYQISVNQKPYYLATTEIRPISTFQEFKYETYNSYINLTVNLNKDFKVDTFNMESEDEFEDDLNDKIEIENIENKKEDDEISFKQINKKYLLDLFIEKLNENKIFIDAIKKFNLVPKDNYKNEQVYEDEVSKLAGSIYLLPPNNFKERGFKEKYWRIQFKTTDKENWEQFLKYIQKPTNEEIRSYVELVFKELISNEKKLKKFKIEDIEMKIQSASETYDRENERKLIFLKEQAQMARLLNIPNLIDDQSLDPEIIANLISQIPHYMKGYEVIEKEIELIENRTNAEAFDAGLNKLEKVKKELISNRDLERLEALFKDTPITDSDKFSAANIMFLSTKYDLINKSTNNIRMAIIAIILGAIIGIFYVLIENAIRTRR